MPKYKVTGTQKVLGANPGDTITVTLSKDQEARLIERGSLSPINQTKPLNKEASNG